MTTTAPYDWTVPHPRRTHLSNTGSDAHPPCHRGHALCRRHSMAPRANQPTRMPTKLWVLLHQRPSHTCSVLHTTEAQRVPSLSIVLLHALQPSTRSIGHNCCLHPATTFTSNFKPPSTSKNTLKQHHRQPPPSTTTTITATTAPHLAARHHLHPATYAKVAAPPRRNTLLPCPPNRHKPPPARRSISTYCVVRDPESLRKATPHCHKAFTLQRH